jgi:hypothetical protein
MDGGISTDSQKFYNPIWWPGVIHGVMWASGMIIVMWLWIILDGTPIHIIIVLVSIPLWLLCFYATGFGSEIVYRPRFIQIVETGVVLHHRIGRKVEEIPWSKILDVTIPNKKGPLESGRDGWLGISKRKRWNVHIPILIQIKEKYIEKMGRVPINYRDNA